MNATPLDNALILSTGICPPYAARPQVTTPPVAVSTARALLEANLVTTSCSCAWTAEESPPEAALPHVTTLPFSLIAAAGCADMEDVSSPWLGYPHTTFARVVSLMAKNLDRVAATCTSERRAAQASRVAAMWITLRSKRTTTPGMVPPKQ
jgi:hypothetical protein